MMKIVVQKFSKMICLSRFSRVTSQKFIPEIDGLRFVAIVPVILLHFGTAMLDYSLVYEAGDINTTSILRRILLDGDLGVMIFFAISGFILALPFAKHHLMKERKVELGGYFVRRIKRLEPPYIITLVGFLLIHILIVREHSLGDLSLSFLASVFYLHNLIFGEWSLVNPVAWSLEVEVQFYILVPLLTQLFRISASYRRGTMFLLIISAPFVQAAIPLQQWNLGRSVLSYYEFFLVGFLFCDFFLSGVFSKSIYWDLFGIISIPLLWWLKVLGNTLSETLFPLSIFLFFVSVFYSFKWNKVFCNQWVATIGGMCYITYLIHYPLMHLILRVTQGWSPGLGYTADFVILSVLWIPMIFIVCSVAFILLEKPFMYPRWPQQFWTYVLTRWPTGRSQK